MKECLQREYGRSFRGEKIEGVKRGARFNRANVIGVLCNEEYFAVECYKHNTNKEFFNEWFTNRLLHEIPKGYTVIMDNARFHCKKTLRKLARGNVKLLFLRQIPICR